MPKCQPPTHSSLMAAGESGLTALAYDRYSVSMPEITRDCRAQTTSTHSSPPPTPSLYTLNPFHPSSHGGKERVK